MQNRRRSQLATRLNVTVQRSGIEIVVAASVALLLTACAERSAPAVAPPAGAINSGYALTQNEMTAGVLATDIVAASYAPLDPRRYGASAADGAENSDQAALQMAVDVA